MINMKFKNICFGLYEILFGPYTVRMAEFSQVSGFKRLVRMVYMVYTKEDELIKALLCSLEHTPPKSQLKKCSNMNHYGPIRLIRPITDNQKLTSIFYTDRCVDQNMLCTDQRFL